MSKLATFVVAVGALVLAFVTLSPSSAEAGWRRGGLGRTGRERLCRTALGLVRPALSLLGALRLRLPLRLLSLLARALLARLVLGTSASKAFEGPLPKGRGPLALRRGSFSLNAR